MSTHLRLASAGPRGGTRPARGDTANAKRGNASRVHPIIDVRKQIVPPLDLAQPASSISFFLICS